MCVYEFGILALVLAWFLNKITSKFFVYFWYTKTFFILNFSFNFGIVRNFLIDNPDLYVQKLIMVSIKTHGSESRGQEEAGLRDEPVSYLQVAPL